MEKIIGPDARTKELSLYDVEQLAQEAVTLQEKAAGQSLLNQADAQTALGLLKGETISPAVASKYMHLVEFDHTGRMTGGLIDGARLRASDVDALKGAVVQDLRLTNSTAPRDARRTEGDVVLQFTAALKSAAERASEPEKEALTELADSFKALWLSGRMNRESTGKLLGEAVETLKQSGPELAAMAGTLKAEVEGSPAHLSQYHDNFFGRTFETEVAAYLVHHPPQPVLDAASRLGNFMVGCLSEDSLMKCDPECIQKRKEFLKGPIIIAQGVEYINNPPRGISQKQALADIAERLGSTPVGWNGGMIDTSEFIEDPSLENFNKLASQVRPFKEDSDFAKDPSFGNFRSTILVNVVEIMKSDPRPWHAETPEVGAFIENPSFDNFDKMASKTETGFDVMKQSWLAVKFSLVLRHEFELAPWQEESQRNYDSNILIARSTSRTPLEPFEVVDGEFRYGGRKPEPPADGKYSLDIHPERERDAVDAEDYKPVKLTTRGYGTRLPHQPAPWTPDDWKEGQLIQANMSVDTHNPKEFEKSALSNNQYTVNGASGSTTILAFMYRHMQANEMPDIDVPDTFAGAMMFLTFDGGHSLAESTGTYHSLWDGPDNPSMVASNDDRRERLASHTARYAELSGMFKSPETRGAVDAAVTHGFDRTLESFAQIHAERLQIHAERLKGSAT